MPSAKLLVFASVQLACIKVVGRANFTSSIDFKTVVNELWEKGFSCFVLDLSDCALMDSTFLGVLSGFGLKMAIAPNGQPTGRAIELVNPNPRVADLLENLGVLHLFKVVQGTAELPEGVVSSDATTASAPTREDISRTCLEAHQILMAIAPANITKFKEVAQFLAEDLRKIKVGPSSSSSQIAPGSFHVDSFPNK